MDQCWNDKYSVLLATEPIMLLRAGTEKLIIYLKKIESNANDFWTERREIIY